MVQRLKLFALSVSFALLASVNPVMAQSFTGKAEAVDGDSLMINGQMIRLFGIDAPEALQPCHRGGSSWQCGIEAKNQLAMLTALGPVTCHGRDVDAYKRVVAVCDVDGIQINQSMVESGWATAYDRFGGDYVRAEAEAKVYRLGIWDSEFVAPEEFRAAKRGETTAPARVAAAPVRAVTRPVHRGGCNIKGNRSRRGEWIYHLPGMEFYEETRAEEVFCSEREAQAAGYRASRSG